MNDFTKELPDDDLGTQQFSTETTLPKMSGNQFVGPPSSAPGSAGSTDVGLDPADPESFKTKALGVGGALAKGFQAYQAFQGTLDANRRIVKVQSAVAEADAVNMAGVVQGGALEKLKSNRFGQRVQGRMAVVFGEAGGGGASAEAVKRQATFNTAENNQITDLNTATRLRSIRSASRAQIDALNAQKGDPYMAAFSALL